MRPSGVRRGQQPHGKRHHPNRVLLDVVGAAADVEKAFRVRMQVYQHPTEPRTFYATDVEPSVDTELQILDISGLNNHSLPRRAGHKPRPRDGVGLTQTLGTGSGPGGLLTASDLRAAYASGVTLTGAGQKVALVVGDGYYASDILAYERSNNLPNISLTNILFGGASGQPGYRGNLDACGETTMDIELVMAMAPGLSQILVYEGMMVGYRRADERYSLP